MTGNPNSSPPSTRFLLDESLVPAVAEALSLVEYDFDVLAKGTLDPDIIAWCESNQAVWVHADDQARRAHRAQLQTSGIRTIRLQRGKRGMSGKEQLRILSFILPHFLKAQAERPRVRHYIAKAANELAKPTLQPVPL